MDDRELYEFLDETLNESTAPAPPGVEQRYQAMIRASFAAAPAELPGWRAMAVLVVCVSAVLVQLLGAGFSVVFAAITVACAGLYAMFIRFAARVTPPPKPT